MLNRSRWIAVLAGLLALGACSRSADTPGRSAAAGQPPAPSRLEFDRLCTAAAPDVAEARDLLSTARFDELDALLLRLHHDYWGDPACENRIWVVSETLETMSRDDLDAWIVAKPDSWAALGIRGSRLVSEGYGTRGGRSSPIANRVPGNHPKRTRERRLRSMRQSFDAATPDFERALELEPRAIVAAGRYIKMLRAHGTKKQIAEQLARTLTHDPLTFGVRVRALWAFSPRWGGSLEAMESVAKNAQEEVDRNPRLRLLLGFPHAERGTQAQWRTPDEAIVHFKNALSYGGIPNWYQTTCQIYERQKNYRAAVRSAAAWLEYEPELPEALIAHGSAYAQLEAMEKALADLDRAIELAPDYAGGYRTRYWVRHRSRNYEGAAADLYRALELNPADTWAVRNLGLVLTNLLSQPEAAVPVYRHWISIAPDTPEAWFGLGTALHAMGHPDAASTLSQYSRIAQGNPKESSRLGRAQLMLNPTSSGDPSSMPALSRVMANSNS